MRDTEGREGGRRYSRLVEENKADRWSERRNQREDCERNNGIYEQVPVTVSKRAGLQGGVILEAPVPFR